MAGSPGSPISATTTKNKIVAPLDVMGQTGTGNNILQWSNAKKAVVEGLEGNLLVPCTRTLAGAPT